MYEANVELKLRGPSKYYLERAVELEGVRLETRGEDDVIYGEVTVAVEGVNPDLIKEEVFRKADKVALLLTLHLGEGFTVEDIAIKPVKRLERNVEGQARGGSSTLCRYHT